MAEAEDALKTGDEVCEMNYSALKKYALAVGLEVPFGILKKGLIRMIFREGKFKEDVPKTTAYVSPRVNEVEAEAWTIQDGEVDDTAAGRRRTTVRFTGKPVDAVDEAGGRKRGSSRRKTNFWTALDIMKSIHLFADWKPHKIEELVKQLETVEFAQGMDLTVQGQVGDEFYIIVDGVCEVIIDGELKEGVECKEGDYVGERALLAKDSIRTATVRAKTDVFVYSVSAKIFKEVIQTSVSWKKRNKGRKAVGVKKKKKRRKKKKKSSKLAALSPEEIKFLVGAISRLEFFSDYTPAQLHNLASQMKKREIPDEEVIIRQGDRNADTFYVVGKGQFDILVDKQKIAEKHSGQCVGEVALMFDQPRNATVVAAGDSVVWELSRDVFREALSSFVKVKNEEMQKFLQQVPSFKLMTSREISSLVAAFDRMELPANTVIIQEGDTPNEHSKCYVLKEGTVTWSKDEENHKHKPAHQRPSVFEGTLPAPTLFGELALLNDEPRAATITTLTECVILSITREEFNDLLGNLEDIRGRTSDFYDELVEAQMPQQAAASPAPMDMTPLDELEEIGVLGKGAYGLVTLVKDPNTQKSYALKAIKKSKVVENGMEEYIMAEKYIMQRLQNPFLVNLKTTYMTSKYLYFLLEVCLGGELFTLLREKNFFDEPTARFYTGCVVEGFAYMHSRNIIYRDLKPENLVLDSRGYLKIADFGFAKEISDRTYTFCGTPDYLAPEVINGKGHSFGVDWWTLGVLLFEMLSSTPPFVDHEVHATYKKILKSHVRFPRFFSKTSKTLILGLLRKKQTRRLGVIKGGAETIRNHPFFEQAEEWDWESLQNQTMQPPIIPELEDAFDLHNFADTMSESETESEDARSIEESEDEFFDGFDE